MVDPRIRLYREAALAMKNGQFDISLPVEIQDEVSDLGRALVELGRTVETRLNALRQIVQVTERINAGLLLDDVLDYIYESFRPIIPYNRIGFSLLNEDGTSIVARWARTDSTALQIGSGYSAPLNGSSLQRVLENGNPRILNDLETYLSRHPASESTALIVKEGMMSSLTCPLVAMDKPIGFIFFSSREKNAYQNVHVEVFRQIAGQLSTIVEKARLYQDLIELNQLKNRFLGIAAHDLRNPLTIQKGFTSLLKRMTLGPLNEKQQQALFIVEEACDTMLAMVNDLLDVSAIESGKLDLTLQEVDVPAFMDRVFAANEILASAKQMTIKVELPEAVPQAFMDPKRVTQVMNNLISNAIKFSHPGSAITIGVRIIEDDGHEFYVSDEGQGIPQAELPNLFTEFGKLSVRPTGQESSTGLGLAIVKKMVDAHGGRVWAKSEFGKGSTFGFLIPFFD